MSRKNDPLAIFKEKTLEAILSEYPSIESFCFAHDLPRASVTRVYSSRDKRTMGFQIRTLQTIAEALGKTLIIDVE